MSNTPERDPNDGPPDSRMSERARRNLTALGAAAVLTVYSAGYARTKEAAERFEREDSARRRPGPMAADEVAMTPMPARAADATPVTDAPSGGSTVTATSGSTPIKSAPATAVRAEHAQPSLADSASAVHADTSGHVAKPGAAVAGAAAASDSTVTTTTSATASTAATANANSGADSAQRSDARVAQWRDGVYSGWGTSRHGDIQAAVEIKDGQIVDAYITQCLTRYSCSWISMLPRQVVTRQSPEVDFISGATQSTNAFYYAIVQALGRAK